MCAFGMLTMPLDARADGGVAKRWVDQAFRAVRTGSPASHTGTPGAARLYAMLGGAMYDAVNGIDRAVGASQLEPWLVSSDGAPVGGNREHAAASAAHAVLVALFSTNAVVVESAANLLTSDCPLPITDSSEAGCRWGKGVGAAVVAARSNDGTVDDQGTVSSLSDTVRLFALLSIAVGDAVATSWTDKHGFHYWRPGDAIRQADIDGNDATELDTSWNPRGGAACALDAPLSTCSGFGGTPEHTSGTSSFAGAASTVLEGFYCRNNIAFAFVGEQPGATSRSYTSFRRAAAEAGRSRVYGGIHFQFSIEKGYEAGKDIAREILRTRLTPEGSNCRGNKCACLPR
jgi:hypothetical protein